MKASQKALVAVICLLNLISCVFGELAPHIHQLTLPNTLQKTHQFSSNLRSHEKGSVGDSITGAIFGFLFGPILFFTAFVCIWFNEKRAVIDHRRLKKAEEICIDVNPLRREEISAAHMRLTHISGNSTTNEITRDALSNVVANGAIKIRRQVEVMEWRANVTDRNGSRDVEYYLGWQSSNTPVVQGRSNPSSNWFVKGETIYNPRVFVGQYLLTDSQKDQCQKSNPINPEMNNANFIAQNVQRNVRPTIQDGWIYFPSQSNPNSISDHGALRIKYSYCPVGPISLMAKTVGNSFEQFPIAQYQGNGKIQKNELPACCCISNCVADLLKPIQEINLVEEQILNKNEMIDKAVKKSQLLTWIIRVASFFMMVFGICMFFAPITAILGAIPLIGGILKGTVGFAIFLAALIVCIPLWIIAFSAAWLWYHPKVGVIFLGIGLLILGLILFLNYSRKGNTQAAITTAQTVKHLMRDWTH